MSVDLNIRKEMFSMAYISAIAAQVGLEVSNTKYEAGSVDGMLTPGRGKSRQLNFQAKATAQDVLRDEYVAFRLNKKNYNDLCDPGVTVPIILVVLIMPDDMNEWLTHTADELTLRRCAYWTSLRDKSETEQETETIHIPTVKMFDQNQLADMWSRVRNGGLP